jgi:hypothetical protein
VSEFSAAGAWIFASPSKLGRLPYSYTDVWRELERASKEAPVSDIRERTVSGTRTARGWTP